MPRSYEWFKVNSKGWLTGSIRAQMSPEERGVWADLLALANESRTRGIIQRANGIPYEREYIASLLGVSVDLLNSTIEKCVNDVNADDPNTRIMINEYGAIVIANWEKYQAKPEWLIRKEENLLKALAKKTKEASENKTLEPSEDLAKVADKVDKAIKGADELPFRGMPKQPREQ